MPPSFPIASPPRQWDTLVGLAWRDAWHEWKISLCLVLALAAVLSPLLVLFALKSGIVTTLVGRLKSDPRNLEIVLVGNNKLAPDWFAELAKSPEVGFIAPRTRSLAATIDVVGPQRSFQSAVDMLPTAVGDPLLASDEMVPTAASEVVLSHTLARKLDVNGGGSITGHIRRTLDGKNERLRLALTVTGVLPEGSFGGDAVFVTRTLIIAAEDFRDGFALPEFDVVEGSEQGSSSRSFASARLYARTLDDVAPLAVRLRSEGLDVRTRAKEIEDVRAIDRVLTFLFLVIALLGSCGYLISLAASLWANVDRKRKDLALLRLIGFRSRAIMLFPAAQALIVATCGVVMSLCAYLGIASLLNAVLSENLARDEFVARLRFEDAGLGALLTVVAALVASVLGGIRAARIDPAESLRDV
jgi:putative ABC transport system permease protein